MEETEIS